MGNYVNRHTLIDPDTGEILKDQTWLGYDGFTDKGYAYRRRSKFTRYYPDAIPDNLDKNDMLLLFMLAELANDENMLVYKVKRKSKFSNIIYKPMDKEYIQDHLRFHYGDNKFQKSWSHLIRHCVKRFEYRGNFTYGLNPAVISNCQYIPIWLYEEFQEYINPYLSATAIKKFQNKIDSQYD